MTASKLILIVPKKKIGTGPNVVPKMSGKLDEQVFSKKDMQRLRIIFGDKNKYCHLITKNRHAKCVC